MGRQALVVVLLVAVGQAQMGMPMASHPEPTRIDPTGWHPSWIGIYKQHHAFRRGTEEGILLAPDLEPNASDIPVYWGGAQPDNGEYFPLKLEIVSSPDFTVTKVQYPKSRKIVLKPGTVIHAVDAVNARIFLRLRADRNAQLGNRTIRGKLRFQRIGKVGVSEPQSLEFDIPVQVVEHSAKVGDDAGNYAVEGTPGQIIRMVLFFPFIVFFLPNC